MRAPCFSNAANFFTRRHFLSLALEKKPRDCMDWLRALVSSQITNSKRQKHTAEL
jgi:hypothetical protein